jgi:hypothetical protein
MDGQLNAPVRLNMVCGATGTQLRCHEVGIGYAGEGCAGELRPGA